MAKEISFKDISIFHLAAEMAFKYISYLERLQPVCSAEQTHLCYLVEGIMGNIHVKLFEIWTSGSGDAV